MNGCYEVCSLVICSVELTSVDFLRLSRATIDDSIIQNLNALVRPGSRPFDPSITSSRQVKPAFSSASRQHIDSSGCDEFIDKVLFPSWAVRDDVIKYCLSVALAPRTNEKDPEALERAAADQAAANRVVDERLDPYSGRYFPKKLRQEALLDVLQNEVAVESIVRDRTRSVIEERCDNGRGKSDFGKYAAWKRQREREHRDGAVDSKR
jgi:Caffeine-induced death protein 2